MSLELIDENGMSLGIFKGVKNKHDGRDCYQFAGEDEIVTQAKLVKVVASGETFPIAGVGARVFSDVIAWRDAFVEPAATATGQTFVFSNASIGQFNAAAGDIVVLNESAFGASAAEIQQIIDTIKITLRESTEIGPEPKADAMDDIDSFVREAQRPKPRAERLLDYLGHINNIAGLAGLAGQLGTLLARAGFG